MNRMLSPKELARAVDVSESSLKRWADSGRIQATRTAGGHRRIPLGEALRFLRESRLELVRPEALGLHDLEFVSPDLRASESMGDRLLAHLEAGRTEAARGLVLWRYLRGDGAAALCDGPIQSAMEAIGKAWLSRPDGIFVEHRATDICLQALDQLRLLADPPSDAPVVVGGAPDRDPYILPSVMAATALSSEGMRAVNLGPDTPARTLATAASHYRARLVWISITSDVPGRETLEQYVRDFFAAAAGPVTLMIGGRSSTRMQHLRSARIHIGETMGELVAFARGRLMQPD